MADNNEHIPATEEERDEYFEQMIVDSFEKWFGMPCPDFPGREGFEL